MRFRTDVVGVGGPNGHVVSPSEGNSQVLLQTPPPGSTGTRRARGGRVPTADPTWPGFAPVTQGASSTWSPSSLRGDGQSTCSVLPLPQNSKTPGEVSGCLPSVLGTRRTPSRGTSCHCYKDTGLEASVGRGHPAPVSQSPHGAGAQRGPDSGWWTARRQRVTGADQVPGTRHTPAHPSAHAWCTHPTPARVRPSTRIHTPHPPRHPSTHLHRHTPSPTHTLHTPAPRVHTHTHTQLHKPSLSHTLSPTLVPGPAETQLDLGPCGEP